MKNRNTRTYRSDAFAAIHESAEALHRVAAINKTTMREFDEACLETVKDMNPSEIRALREHEHVRDCSSTYTCPFSTAISFKRISE